MPEDVELNTTLGTIRAVDFDRKENGYIMFEIISGDRDRFSLVSMQIDSLQTHVATLINNEVSMGQYYSSIVY